MSAPDPPVPVKTFAVPLEDAVWGAARAFPGQVGVCALLAQSGERLLVNAERPFPIASTMKLFVLVALYQASAQGGLDLEQRLEVGGRDHCLGSGVLAHLADPVALTLRDLATLMMMVSDNTAANLLIDVLGVSRIRRTIRDAGLASTHFAGPVDFSVLAHDKHALGTSTPLELASFMMRLYENELLPVDLTARVIDTLRIQKYIEPMRRLLPVDPYAREFGEKESVWVASKTGSLDGVRVEAGLVHVTAGASLKTHGQSTRARAEADTTRKAGDRTWALSVMTEKSSDLRVTSDNEAVRLIGQVSRQVFDAWSK